MARWLAQRSALLVFPVLLVVLGLTGCMPRETSAPPSRPAASASTSPTGDGSVASAAMDRPPTAALATEGGDPVVAQLGTYVWRDTGSDSPWLPGAAIAVGTGEPLGIIFDPAIGVTAWTARYVRSTATEPTGAIAIGSGAGAPAFGAPPAGSWTVEVQVTFVRGLGIASYYWMLEVD